jgi:hypothetical protein
VLAFKPNITASEMNQAQLDCLCEALMDVNSHWESDMEWNRFSSSQCRSKPADTMMDFGSAQPRVKITSTPPNVDAYGHR